MGYDYDKDYDYRRTMWTWKDAEHWAKIRGLDAAPADPQKARRDLRLGVLCWLAVILFAASSPLIVYFDSPWCKGAVPVLVVVATILIERATRQMEKDK